MKSMEILINIKCANGARRLCDPLSAAIGVGASVVGGMMSEDSNKRSQRRAFQYQSALNTQQNNFTERMWNANNAYNTPLNQASRLAAAGLNPQVANDKGQTTTGTSTPASASSSGLSMPQGVDYTGLAANTAQMVSAMADSRLKNNEADKVLNDMINDNKRVALETDDRSMQREMNEAQRGLFTSQIQRNSTMNLLDANTMSLQDEQQRQMRLRFAIDKALNDSNIAVNDANVRSIEQCIQYYPFQQQTERIAALASDRSSRAAMQQAATAAKALKEDINRYFEHNIPGLRNDTYRRNKLTNNAYMLLLQEQSAHASDAYKTHRGWNNFWNYDVAPIFGGVLGSALGGYAIGYSHKMLTPKPVTVRGFR